MNFHSCIKLSFCFLVDMQSFHQVLITVIQGATDFPDASVSSSLDYQYGQIKKIPVFRATRPYLNLLVKPKNYFQVIRLKYNFMHLKGETPFKGKRLSKCIELFFSRKKERKNVCAYPT